MEPPWPPREPTKSPATHDPARLDTVVNLGKRRGFVFPSGEIYGGTRSAWDYGPLGVELKDNIKRQWWQHHGAAAATTSSASTPP